MRKTMLIPAMLMLSSSLAMAQEAPNAQTLDEQMRRVQAGQPAVPLADTRETSQDVHEEMPGEASPIPAIGPEGPIMPATAQQQQMQPAPAPEPPPSMPSESERKRFTAMPTAAPAAPSVARSGEVIQSEGGGAIPALPLTMMEANGIRYVTGGVGDEEEAQLKSLERDYNLQLLIAGKDGAYIGGALVRILSESGSELLLVEPAGPYFYAQLPAGSYTLEVTTPQGGIQKQTVKVPASGAAKPIMRFSA